MSQKNYIWSDKKRTLFGLPLSFTRYTLTSEKLLIKIGFLSIKEEEIKLYRILDFTVRKTLFQRIFGVGDIELHTADRSTPIFMMKGVKNVDNIKEEPTLWRLREIIPNNLEYIKKIAKLFIIFNKPDIE